METTPQPHKAGFVAIIGRPNVGKSTLVNSLIGEKLVATSAKAHTTVETTRAILTRADGQAVFMDTPGIHRTTTPDIPGADVILFVVEPVHIGPGDRRILYLLEDIKTPVILVINKIDMANWERLLFITEAFSKERDFAEIVPVSAYEGDNLDELADCVMKYLPEGPPLYDPDAFTDRKERELIAEIIREKAFHVLYDEVPHLIEVVVEDIKWRSKLVDIHANILCTREAHVGIVIGKHGGTLNKIGSNARYEIERMLKKQVNLKLWVKAANPSQP
jgi:GTP-binding protein Era